MATLYVSIVQIDTFGNLISSSLSQIWNVAQTINTFRSMHWRCAGESGTASLLWSSLNPMYVDLNECI